MNATFLVEIDVPATDPASLSFAAGDIQDTLEADGFDVSSVKAWSRSAEASITSPQTQQTQQTQQ